MSSTNSTLFTKVKHYIKLSKNMQMHLLKYPDEWQKFQLEFDSIIEQISQEIQQIERDNVDNELNTYRLKRIFEKKYRRYFLYGEYPRWCLEKPFGYPGDFKIIDDIYRNQPRTIGFDRLCDNHFLQLAAAKATRERKEDFKTIILDFVRNHKGQNICIMNLGSGPAREIKELLEADSNGLFLNVIFDCYDFDTRAIDYAREVIGSNNNINFLQKNVIRFALKKDIKEEVQRSYDLIYSAGLFDYLDERVAVRLVSNLNRLLKSDGIMLISNYRDKFSNPSAGLMEWVAEWNLIYRTEDEFKNFFLDTGFPLENLQIISQRSKIMQYCFITKR